jgi:hypothetical protein
MTPITKGKGGLIVTLTTASDKSSYEYSNQIKGYKPLQLRCKEPLNKNNNKTPTAVGGYSELDSKVSFIAVYVDIC